MAGRNLSTEVSVESEYVIPAVGESIGALAVLDLGVKLVVNEAARGYLVENGWDEKYGARPLRRAVERLLEDPLAEAILRNDYNKDEPVIVSVGEKGLVFTQKKSGADTEPKA